MPRVLGAVLLLPSGKSRDRAIEGWFPFELGVSFVGDPRKKMVFLPVSFQTTRNVGAPLKR